MQQNKKNDQNYVSRTRRNEREENNKFYQTVYFQKKLIEFHSLQ